jgi:acyl-CoA reductase-like NAD-dependent aldehyde dehydrogenase
MMSSTDQTQKYGRLTVPHWINGKEEQTSGTFEIFSPSLNDVCWDAAVANRDDAVKAVDSAQEAFRGWSNSKPALRSKVLLKTASIMEVNVEEYSTYYRP